MTLEDGTDRFSRNVVTNDQSMLCNIPEERTPQSKCALYRIRADCNNMHITHLRDDYICDNF